MNIRHERYGIHSCISLLVYSNLITAVSCSALTLLTFLLLNCPVIVPIMLVVFSGTLLIYTFNRFTDIHEDSINLPERVTFIRNFGKVILLIALFLYIVSLALVASGSTIAGIVAVIPVIIAVLYSYFRLKKIFLIKNILISTGGVCSVLVAGTYYSVFSATMFFLTVLVFNSIFVNTLIFDVKDMKGDKACNIQTIPTRYGLRRTKYCCYLLLISLFLITIYFITEDLRFSIFLPFLGYIMSYTYFLKDPDQYPEWYFGLYVDGEYVFLLLLIIIFFVCGVFTVH